MGVDVAEAREEKIPGFFLAEGDAGFPFQKGMAGPSKKRSRGGSVKKIHLTEAKAGKHRIGWTMRSEAQERGGEGF